MRNVSEGRLGAALCCTANCGALKMGYVSAVKISQKDSDSEVCSVSQCLCHVLDADELLGLKDRSAKHPEESSSC